MAEEKITISKLPYQVNLTDDMALPVEDLDATYSVGIGDLRKHLNSKLVEMVDTDFDNLRAAGTFLLHGTSGNAPADAAAAYLVQVATQAGKTVQIAVGLDDKGEYPATFKRRYTGAEWTPWTSTNTQLTPWAINSGHAVNGQNAVMEGVGTVAITFNTSEPIVMTSAEGVTAEVANIAPITPLNNGDHNVFYDIATSEARVYANKVYIQDAAPEAPQRFDVWLDTSKEPLKCYQYAGSWVPRQIVWLGSVKVAADNIVELKNRSFNIDEKNYTFTKKAINFETTIETSQRIRYTTGTHIIDRDGYLEVRNGQQVAGGVYINGVEKVWNDANVIVCFGLSVFKGDILKITQARGYNALSCYFTPNENL